MDLAQLKSQLLGKPDAGALAAEAIRCPSLIAGLISLAQTDPGSLKFLCTKIVRLVSEQAPDLVYGHFDEIVRLMRSKNSFVQWDGITILANLAGVDTAGRFDTLYPEYFGLLKAPRMITAANVVGSAWKIAVSKPHYEPDITQRLAAVSTYTYYIKGNPSPECRNVICGHVIDSFDRYFAISSQQQAMLAFVRTQLDNPRPQVAQKAAAFLKKHAPVR